MVDAISKILKLPNRSRTMKSCSYYFLYGFIAILRPKRVLEIGTARGHSALVMAQAMKDHKMLGHVWSIDKNEKYLKEAQANIKTVGLESYITLVHGNSAVEAKKFGDLDMVFHDGCHEWKGVEKDFNAIKDSTRWILFHDSSNREWEGVYKIVNKLKRSPGWDVINIYEPHMKGLAVCKKKANVFEKWLGHVQGNLLKNRNWYRGLPYRWWYGQSIVEFLEALPRHLDPGKEPKWFIGNPSGPNPNESPEDYDRYYSMPSYKDKIVLDVGADYGSSACWFLQKGAKQVIAVEMKEAYFEQLMEYAEDVGNNRIIPVKLNVSRRQDYECLLCKYRPDIVKVDCEGCEVHLLAVEESVFYIPKEYVIETHTEKGAEDFLKKLKQSYDAKIVVEVHPPWCNVIYARKR